MDDRVDGARHPSGRWRVATVAGLVFLSIGFTPAPRAQSRASACGESAKPANLAFVLTDMNGVQVRLADLRGKVIVVHFWATWCPTCAAEMKALEALQQAHGARGLQVLGVSIDDSPDRMRDFARKQGITFPLIQGRGRDDVKQAYGPVWAVPTTAVVSRDGRICRKLLGFSTRERHEASILGLF